MNVTIETETKYLNIINNEVVDYWYSLECAEDYQKEFGGEIKVYETYREVPQSCEIRTG